jgi:hypothetical protein
MPREGNAHFSLAPHASISDNPALSHSGGRGPANLKRTAVGNQGHSRSSRRGPNPEV